MQQTLMYRLSLGLTILFTLAAFVTLLGWLGALIHSVGHLPALALVPWNPLGLIGLAAVNCSIRARLIVRRRSMNL